MLSTSLRLVMARSIPASSCRSLHSSRAKSMQTSSSKREVFVSQTRDMMANSALEEWTAKNLEGSHKSLLLLTNNINKNRGVDIKATFFLCNEEPADMTEMEALVFTSLPQDLLMKAPPVVSINNLLEEGGQRCLSVKLELVKEVKTKTVLGTLELMGKKFLGNGSSTARIKLVRPDNDWFPGLGKLKAELEHTVSNLLLLSKAFNTQPF